MYKISDSLRGPEERLYVFKTERFRTGTLLIFFYKPSLDTYLLKW